MAPGLRPWVLGTLGACVVVALAAFTGGLPAPPQVPPPAHPTNRWALEAGALARRWQATEFRRRLEVYRDQLQAPADSARAAGGTAPLLLIDGGATPAQRAELRGFLSDIWKQAAPLGFKVAVGVVIVRESATKTQRDAPSLEHAFENAYYLFPDSLHRGLCLSVLSDRYYYGREFFDPHRKAPYRLADGIRWLQHALGPCAFYGAFGIPGHEMGRWINGEGYPFLLWPQWWMLERQRDYWPTYQDRSPSRQPASWWVNTYSWIPWEGIGCYAGRAQQCAADVFDSTALSDSQPAHWSASEWWRDQPMYDSRHFLSDVAQDIGAERFSQLWTADVPMDSAFHLATGRTLDLWTRDWARRTMPPLQLGAAASLLDILTGLIPALIALGAALWYARRRQIG